MIGAIARDARQNIAAPIRHEISLPEVAANTDQTASANPLKKGIEH